MYPWNVPDDPRPHADDEQHRGNKRGLHAAQRAWSNREARRKTKHEKSIGFTDAATQPMLVQHNPCSTLDAPNPFASLCTNVAGSARLSLHKCRVSGSQPASTVPGLDGRSLVSQPASTTVPAAPTAVLVEVPALTQPEKPRAPRRPEYVVDELRNADRQVAYTTAKQQYEAQMMQHKLAMAVREKQLKAAAHAEEQRKIEAFKSGRDHLHLKSDRGLVELAAVMDPEATTVKVSGEYSEPQWLLDLFRSNENKVILLYLEHCQPPPLPEGLTHAWGQCGWNAGRLQERNRALRRNLERADSEAHAKLIANTRQQ